MEGAFAYVLYDANGDAVYNGDSQSDFFIAKYATQACNEAPVTATDTYKEARIKTYPNPVKERLYLELSTAYSYRIYQFNGLLVKEGNFSSGSASIAMENLQRGLYLIELTAANGNRQTLKTLKE